MREILAFVVNLNTIQLRCSFSTPFPCIRYWCDARRTRLYCQSQRDTTLLFLFVLSMYSVHACGVRSIFPGAWSSWIFACRQFAPKIVDVSVRFFRFRSIYSLRPTIDNTLKGKLIECVQSKTLRVAKSVRPLLRQRARYIFLACRGDDYRAYF